MVPLFLGEKHFGQHNGTLHVWLDMYSLTSYSTSCQILVLIYLKIKSKFE